MQFQTIPSNVHGRQVQRINSFPETDEVNAFLLAQATNFVNQNTTNAKVVHHGIHLQPHQRQHIHHNLNIQPYYSDQPLITQHVKPPVIIDRSADLADTDLDQYLTLKAEELVRKALGTQSDVENAPMVLPPTQCNTPARERFETKNQLKTAVRRVQQVQPVQQVQQVQRVQQIQPVQQIQQYQQIQPIQQVQQLNHVQPRQQIQQVQYYTPQVQALPQAQTQSQIQQILGPQAQILEIGKPYFLETNEEADIPFPQVQLDQLVAPTPVIQGQAVVQNEVVNPSPVPQRQQNQAANAKPEPEVQGNMQFVQKGPKGEVLYKTTEGGQTFYVKRGLTEEAVNNYSLAYLIGVGPPVEIIGNDGVKMEEGVNLRHALRDKIITIDEIKAQIQSLHKTLFDTGMAHCDVKFENCLYFPKYKKVLLIDNGDLAIYGNRRKIKTPGANSTLLIHGNEERHRVGPATDLRGFMHIMKNATENEINPVE